jgi:hypothetical protein
MTKDAIARLLIEPTHPTARADMPDYMAFADVSRTLLSSYATLTSNGFSPDTVARAMLGATVNFYEMFGITPDLPDLLRAIAERLECTPS